MTRYKNLSAYKQGDRIGWLVWPTVIVLIAALLTVSIDAIAIDDVNDADEATHIGPVPADVTQMSKTAYLIDPEASLTAKELCLGSTNTSEGPKTTKRINEIDKIFVDCYVDQKWNFVKQRDNPSLGDGYLRSMQKQSIQILFGILLTLSLVYPVFMGFIEGFGAIRDHRLAKKEKKINYHKLTARYRAIQASYARDEIDDLQLDKKLKELVDAGYEVPDKDVFS